MIYYIIIINIISFILYGYDKYLAIKGKMRISEYHLLVTSFFGGSIGSIIGMKVFHHKTKKIKFWILNILFLLVWIYIIKNTYYDVNPKW